MDKGKSTQRGGNSGKGGSASTSNASNKTVLVASDSSGDTYTSASSAKLVRGLAWDMAKASAPNLPPWEKRALAEHFERKFWAD